jgi:hypothetical protein
MKILVLGGDGYIGFPLVCELAHQGHSIHVLDTYAKRAVGHALFDDGEGLALKCKTLNEAFNGSVTHAYCNGADQKHYLSHYLDFAPDTVVNLIDSDEGPQASVSIESLVETVICKTLREDCHYVRLHDREIDNNRNRTVLHYGVTCTTLKSPEVFGIMTEVEDSDTIGLPGDRIYNTNWQFTYGLQTRLFYDEVYGKPFNKYLIGMLCGLDYQLVSAPHAAVFATIPSIVASLSSVIEAGCEPLKHKEQWAGHFSLLPEALNAMVGNAGALYGYDIAFQPYQVKDEYFFKYLCAVINQLRNEIPKIKKEYL